ncbi:cobalamin biosynthesis protein [Methylosinus sp. Sm6]|uniref:cobalamin biosynthesis protein n=1 Tax=Methylosinus sp. Sm6 TaxID=2866948 RepID=UPI001C99FE8C|nr:cobalamin biosynthesis protein [Methylosinus sp. Sm6]MBY6241069.1 cobalamin biosynthesis protein [Methylosinus sp. Sm6]
MRVLGLGFRASAPPGSLRAAAEAAASGRLDRIDRLATAADLAGHPAMRALAEELGLPVVGAPLDRIAAETRAATSPRIPARYGGRSIAEASALIVAGRGGRLIAPRAISPDGTAVAALAEGEGP